MFDLQKKKKKKKKRNKKHSMIRFFTKTFDRVKYMDFFLFFVKN